ncbi:MAG: M67 family metallopeptidase [Treponema sp.]|jgi:proteasome lid subunit RPN8/RPN11|nr:M67 family metallopeptidase [Treponema sp.]
MLIVSSQHHETMLAHAHAGLPNEACGLFAGTIEGDVKTVKAVYGLTNTDQSPEHFSMSPEEQFAAIADIRKQGLVLLGNFHSHPDTPARASAEDIRLAFEPSLSYVIISLQAAKPCLKSFLIRGGIATEETVEVQLTSPRSDSLF